MTSRSSSKKTLQNIHVRDTLWATYGRQSTRMDCSIDYLVNEAMRLYAAQNGFLEDSQISQNRQMPVVDERSGSAPLPRPGGTPAPAPSPPAALGPPPVQTGSGLNPPLPRPGGSGVGTSPTGARAPSTVPPLRPVPPVRTAPVVQPRPTLTLVFRGKKIPVVKDQFIIGRGSKSSDLTIKDGNISRKHAAVIFHNGAFYIKDLGSTNGVEFNGRAVDSKRIDEGDVFSICGYDFHFTYAV